MTALNQLNAVSGHGYYRKYKNALVHFVNYINVCVLLNKAKTN